MEFREKDHNAIEETILQINTEDLEEVNATEDMASNSNTHVNKEAVASNNKALIKVNNNNAEVDVATHLSKVDAINPIIKVDAINLIVKVDAVNPIVKEAREDILNMAAVRDNLPHTHNSSLDKAGENPFVKVNVNNIIKIYS